MDLSHFDIAHYTGHKALDELYKAYLLYKQPVGTALANNIQYTSMDNKRESDISTLSSQMTIQDLDIDQTDPINAFHWGGHLNVLRKKEAEYCMNAAIFFQVMMESIINDALGKSAPKEFAKKWESFLTNNDATKTEQDYFDQYLNNIYRKMRNPIIHGNQRIGIRNTELFRFPHVHENIKMGWYAFVFSLNKLNNYSLDYDKNWIEMCETIHHIPAMISPKSFCDMGKLSGEMNKKHLDFFNNKL